MIFAAVDAAALLQPSYYKRSCPPSTPGIVWASTALFYVPLAALYLVMSKRAKTPELSTTWLWSTHAVVLTSLVLSFAAGPGTTSPIAAMWLAGALYAASAIAFDITAFAGIGALALSIALVLSLVQARVPIGHWYIYVLSAECLAALYLAAESSLRRAERSRLAEVWGVAATALTAGGLIAQLISAVAYLPQFPHFAFSTRTFSARSPAPPEPSSYSAGGPLHRRVTTHRLSVKSPMRIVQSPTSSAATSS